MASTVNIVSGLLKVFTSRFARNNDPALVDQQSAFEAVPSENYDSAIVVRKIGGALWRSKRRLLADTTIYVDSNAGVDDQLPNRGTRVDFAYKTIQFALTQISYSIDPCGFVITLKLADGNYAGDIDLWNTAPTISIIGNVANPANVVINIGTKYGIYFYRASSGLSGVTFSAGTKPALFIEQSYIVADAVVFNAVTAANTIRMQAASRLSGSNLTILGGARSFIFMQRSSAGLSNLTIQNNPAFTFLVEVSLLAFLEITTATVGTATGTAGRVAVNSTIRYPGNFPQGMNPIVADATTGGYIQS